MQQQNYYPIYEEDEIDLKDLIKTLKKRKKTIFITALIFLLLGTIYIIVAKNYYEAKATIQIGKQLIKKSDGSLSVKYFDKASNLKNTLDAKYDTAGKYREKNQTSFISDISVPKGSDGFLTIRSLGLNNQEAIKEIKKPISDILKKHDLYIQSLKDTTNEKIKVLTEKLNFHQNIELKQLKQELELLKSVDLKRIDDNISNFQNNYIPALKQKVLDLESKISKQKQDILKLKKDLNSSTITNPAVATMASMQITSLQNSLIELSQAVIDYKKQIKEIEDFIIPSLQKDKKYILDQKIPQKESEINKLESMVIPKLKSQIEELNISVYPPYIERTKIVGKIYTHDKPVKPKKKLILVVSLLTGLIFGVFLAFFREFLDSLKEEENDISK